MKQHNRQLQLISRPVGLPGKECFKLVDAPAREPSAGEVLVRVKYVSIDPAMRNWMNDAPSYLPPVQPGDVMRAFATGRVVSSGDERFEQGDAVVGMLGVQEYAVVQGDRLMTVDTSRAPIERYLGILGITGLTAYFGLLEIGRPMHGETVLVSSAAGAVGSAVGQIAAIKGCRVVGIAGGPRKCERVLESGFDDVIDYKQGDLSDALSRACPEGIDIYFDNVGGEILDAALARLRLHGRVVICGAISQSNLTGKPRGPVNYRSLLVNRARMEGFIYFDYEARFAEAIAELSLWIEQGRLRSREHVVEGIERFSDHLCMLFNGQNEGKLILRLEADSGR